MPTKRRILVADLDDRSCSAVEECLSADHFEITVFHANEEPAVSGPVDLVILRTLDDLEPTRELSRTIQTYVGEGVPLVACTGRYVFPSIRPLVGDDVQSLLIMPFNARELRRKLDEFDLGL